MKFKKKIVLIVDNDLHYTSEMTQLLNNEGLDCFSMGNEPDYERFVQFESPFLVMLDSSMPDFVPLANFCNNRQIPLIFLCKPSVTDYRLLARFSSFGIVQKDAPFPAVLASVMNAFNLNEALPVCENSTLRNSVNKILFNAMIETVWIIDLDASILDVNSRVEKVLGYSREEILQIGLGGIDCDHTIDDIAVLCRAMPKDKFQVFETVHKKKDGSPIPVEISSILIPYQGSEVILSIARDISERKTAEKEIRRQLAEKETLLRAVHHRMKNHISTISNLLMLQLGSVTNKEALSVLQDAISRVDCMRILYESLLHAADYTNLSTQKYIQTIIDSILSLFPEKGEHISIIIDIEETSIDEKKLFPLGVITEELFTNIFKYAYKHKKSGTVNVSLKKIEKGLRLVIQDDGDGLPEGFDLNTSNGFGLMIVKMLALQLHATFEISNKNGTRSEIVIPVNLRRQ
ncbi:MAG: PAS domain S-box protein [Spirochaetes bacterium]|nr:PAS domain S-box protein [Spirochaetota bacterium]